MAVAWGAMDHAKISTEVGSYLLEAYSTGEVMHAPDCLNAAGAVLGFLTQMQARARLKAGEYTDIKDALMVVNTKAGERLYFGQAINDCLIGEVTGTGVWNYVAGTLGDPEAAEAFDLNNLF